MWFRKSDITDRTWIEDINVVSRNYRSWFLEKWCCEKTNHSKWLAFSFYNRRLDNANNVIGELYENVLNSSVWCIHYYCQKADKKQENKYVNTGTSLFFVVSTWNDKKIYSSLWKYLINAMFTLPTNPQDHQ